MRRRIIWLVAGTTSAVVMGFLLPLCWLVANVAVDRAAARASDQAQSIAGILSTVPDTATVGRATAALSSGGPVVHVVRADGQVFGQSTRLPDDLVAEVARARTERTAYTVHSDHGMDAVVPVVSPAGVDVVIATVAEDEVRAGVTTAWLAIGALGLGLVTGAVLLARELARRVSVPVIEVASAAHRLREGDVTARAPVSGPPETVELGRALNQLAERIEDLVAAERESVADLGHRLRTPLTALRIDAEMIADPALAERLGEHIDHLQRSVDAVVREARRPVRDPLPGGCDLAVVARDRAAFWTPLAEDQGRSLAVLVSPVAGAFPVPVAAPDLAEAVDTALDNVFAHTPDGASIAIHVEHEGGEVMLSVDDSGPGLPAAYAGRGASASGSTGLGLSIITRIVEQSGGRVALRPSALGGLSVALLWPAATRSARLDRQGAR